MEILSPAGSFEALRAAVQNGADAVYFGFGEHNARRGAKNFTETEIKEAIGYCRTYGVQTHITLNTLVSDRELPGLVPMVELIRDAGADAVIAQDLGVARLIHMVAPDLKLHASTQMSLHNLEGVLAAAEMGFSRVVLARELPKAEIAGIAKASPIEIEVFGHGALCMSYSGQCYLSAMVGQRSGNRGMCAGPCRLPYFYFGEVEGYALSLKDLSLTGHLSELAEIGVSAIKIEGRMKRPEYVAAVTGIFANAVKNHTEPTREETALLYRLFSREGFTDGFYEDKKGRAMMGVREEAPHGEAQRMYADIRKDYPYEGECRKVPVEIGFVAERGRPATVIAADPEGRMHTEEAPPLEAARTVATSEDQIKAQLEKSGGTVFSVEKTYIQMDAGLAAPVSVINGLRRAVLDGLLEKRKQPPEREKGMFHAGLKRLNQKEPPVLTASFLSFDQLAPEILKTPPEILYFPLPVIAENAEKAGKLCADGHRLCAVLPRVIFDNQRNEVGEMLVKAREVGIKELLCGNLGQVFLLQDTGFMLRGDFGLNVFNSQALKELKRFGLVSQTLSFELNFPQVRDLSKNMPTELIVYGRLPLMVTETCLIRNRIGQHNCDNPCRLTDRTGVLFPVLKEFACRNVLYNSKKLYLADKKKDYENLGLWAARLAFTTENPRECAMVYESYLSGESIEPNEMTRGLYYRGVL